MAAVSPSRLRTASTRLAAAIACLFNAGDYDSQYVPKLQAYCQRNLSDISNQGFGHWHYAHYYYSQVLFREGGGQWDKYRDTVYGRLRASACIGFVRISWRAGSAQYG